MQTPEKTSQIIASLMSAQTSSQAEVIGTLTVGDLMASLRTRAFGLSLILFGLPNLLPIPGLPILTGIILALLAVQIVLGRDVPWLPARIAGTTLPRERLNQVMARTLPLLRWIERVTKPRFALAAGPTARRVVGLTVLVLAVLLIILPIPWIGSMPQGWRSASSASASPSVTACWSPPASCWRPWPPPWARESATRSSLALWP